MRRRSFHESVASSKVIAKWYVIPVQFLRKYERFERAAWAVKTPILEHWRDK